MWLSFNKKVWACVLSSIILFHCFVLELSAAITLLSAHQNSFLHSPFLYPMEIFILTTLRTISTYKCSSVFLLSHNLVLTVTSLVSLRGSTILDLRYQPLNTALIYVNRSIHKMLNGSLYFIFNFFPVFSTFYFFFNFSCCFVIFSVAFHSSV